MSNYILPIIIFVIILYAVVMKTNIYDSFLKGAKEGLEISLTIFPAILAIIFASRIFIASGFLDFILSLLNPILTTISFPIEVFPMAIIRPISGNVSLSLMLDNFTKYGVDSYIGYLSSLIQGSTDTTFYVVSLYFGVVGIKKIKHSLYTALIVDLIGIITAIILSNLLF